MVSGRVSFEIVQKAAVVGIPIVAAVSAPSDLAIETAERLGVTLVGFLRGELGTVNDAVGPGFEEVFLETYRRLESR